MTSECANFGFFQSLHRNFNFNIRQSARLLENLREYYAGLACTVGIPS